MLDDHKHKHPTHDFDGITENRVNSPPAYFTLLFYGLIIWGVLFCGYYLFSGWSSDQEFQQKMEAHQQAYAQTQAEKPAAAAKPAAAQTTQNNAAIDAKTLYGVRCSGCHGADAKGGFGSDLTGDYQYGKSEAAIRTSIADGRGGKMPGFDDQLSDAEIDALVAYLLSL
jgi:cytochrome c oxidase cbb3-type subunit 3